MISTTVTGTHDIIDDGLFEGNEDQTVRVAATHAGAPAGTAQTVAVVDDEANSQVVLSPASIGEDDGLPENNSQITASVSPPAEYAFVVDLEVEPTASAMAALKAWLDAHFHAAEGAFSANTERAIRGDIKRFAAWCLRQRLRALPANPTTVAAFIDAMGRSHAPASVRRHVSSIATVHKAITAENPHKHVAVQLALRRMHRLRGRRQAQVGGLTWTLIQQLIAHAADRLIDLRNCAMLCVAYDAMLRRSELVALQVPDVLFDPDRSGSVLVQRGKTDPEAEGALQYLHADTMDRVTLWLTASGICDGPLFRSVRKDGRVGASLDSSSVPRIYRAMATCAGMQPHLVKRLSGHSPRIGTTQDMIAAGIAMPAILQAGRWKSTRMVHRYGERLGTRRSGTAQLAGIQERK